MKVKVYSQTGKPTDIDSAIAYEKEFKEAYDALWERKQADKITIEDMKIELEKLDKVLKTKYPMFKEVSLPKSGKQWKAFIMEMGVPLTIAITEENKELAIFLMDAQYE